MTVWKRVARACALTASLWPAAASVTSAQTAAEAPRPVRVMLTSARLSLASDQPLHFQLLRVDLPAGGLATFNGDQGLVFVLAGRAEVVAGTALTRTLDENDSTYLPAGLATVRAVANRPATVLHYVLASRARMATPVYSPAATTTELYRSPDPIPMAGAGPYELSLTRVSSPAGAPPPPLHQRSTAALYYLLAGSGMLHSPQGDERHGTGRVVYEPNGFVHTWENVGAVPLVFLQANLSREGVPEIIWSR